MSAEGNALPTLTVDRIDDSESQWMVRRDGIRLGVVVGGNRSYNAESMGGRHLGTAKTTMGAAAIVAKRWDKEKSHASNNQT